MRFTSQVVKFALLAACMAALGGCQFLDTFVPKKGEQTDVIDRQKNLTVEDFKTLSEIDKDKKSDEEPSVTVALGTPPIPDVAQVLAAPKPPKVGNTKLVTLAVTEDVPLRDVLFELGRLASVDIEVGPGLDRSGINLRATDRPFNEVIERIATLANLRYSTTGKAIRVERDLPYIKNYSLDFLNFVRSSTSNYSLSTSILASGSGSSGGGSSSSGGSSGGSGGGSSSTGTVGNSGSSSSIDTTAESDLWASLEASITEILNYSPVSSGSGDAAAASSSTSASGAAAGSIVINRQAGVLSVNATQRQHEMVQNYLTMMTRNASAQVLIEAKIVEISLLDQFVSGVNWTDVLGNLGGVGASLGTYGASISSGPSTGSASSVLLSVDAGDLEAVMVAAQKFGSTRTLSSPRLAAINNQQAVLTFARNEVFVDCDISEGSTTTTTTTGPVTTSPSVDCSSTSIPIGVILNILPSINLDSQEVTLNVRPTLTRIVGEVDNPGVAIAAQAVGLSLEGVYPVVEVRELDSVMKVKSGGVMVIGGLMEDGSRNESNGVPGLNEVPIFGNLFKSRKEDSFKRELVIFIKATIVNSDGNSHPVDHKLYKKFISDPRPLVPNQ